jgi:hypothetical protein
LMVAQLVPKLFAFTWWASKTRVSPNKDDVTRKCLDVGVWDEKPTHYLMEIQVL